MSNCENKKAFDPTTCFTFFGSWLNAIEALETEQDKNSTAYVLFKSIANYSMYDIEPDFSECPNLKAFWILLEKEIDISIGNRKRGFAKDEMNDKYQSIINAIIEYPEASLRKIGTITGTNKEMVRRVKKKYAEQIQMRLNSAISADTVEDGCNANVTIDVSDDYYIVNDDYYIVNDGIRQDIDEPVRQYYDDDLPF